MNLSHLKVTQAGLVSLLTMIVGQVVAFVPSLAPDAQTLISAGSTVIAAAFLLANAVHHLAASNVSARDVEAGAVNAAKSEVAKVDLNKLAQEAMAAQGVPNIEAQVKATVEHEVQALLAKLATPQA